MNRNIRKPSNSLQSIITLCVTILLICILPLISSCFDCTEYVPQRFRFGSYQIEMKAPEKIHVGDKVLVSVNLPRSFYDSISYDYVDIDRKVSVTLKLDRYTLWDVDSSDFFGTPRTIFLEFDTYFDLKVVKGQPVNVYQYDCSLEGGRWVVELEYTVKQPGAYYFDPNFTEISMSRADLPKGTCDGGDPQYDARLFFNPSNDQIQDLGYFGFIVE
jgi:hypothetical protein